MALLISAGLFKHPIETFNPLFVRFAGNNPIGSYHLPNFVYEGSPARKTFKSP